MKKRIIIIAEAGVNHNGDLKKALKMVDAAKAAGADAVKFQMFKAEDLVTKNAPKAKYQKVTTKGGSQYDMLKKLELGRNEFKKISAYCKTRKIEFMATPFDDESAELLKKLGMRTFKISSGDMNNLPFIAKIARYRRPMIISTGMADLKEVRETVAVARKAGNSNITLLQCTSNYPTDHRNVNLLAMSTLNKAFNVPVGYSDHTLGIEVAIAAAALGAKVIEKHFTLDKRMKGPDHRASLEPNELKEMVRSIRNVEAALGSGKKVPSRSENDTKEVGRKSLVSSKEILKGARIDSSMLAIKRPGTGIEPKYLNRVIGRRAKKSIKADTVLKWGMMQ